MLVFSRAIGSWLPPLCHHLEQGNELCLEISSSIVKIV